MKNIISVCLLFIFLLGASCEEKGYPKPEGLVNEKKMVDVLYDIHLAEAFATRNRHLVNDSNKIESEEIYQAVLNKYGLNDSIMAMSVIYYSARPKVYEKIYAKVVERLNVTIEDQKKMRELKLKDPDEQDKAHEKSLSK